VRLRKNDTYFIQKGSHFIKANKVVTKNVSEYLGIAFDQGELTAAQILAIKVSDANPDVESEIISDLISAD